MGQKGHAISAFFAAFRLKSVLVGLVFFSLFGVFVVVVAFCLGFGWFGFVSLTQSELSGRRNIN